MEMLCGIHSVNPFTLPAHTNRHNPFLTPLSATRAPVRLRMEKFFTGSLAPTRIAFTQIPVQYGLDYM
jgi:hypothetical protein